jgi:hypothetical protein
MQLQTQGAGRRLQLSHLGLGDGTAG